MTNDQLLITHWGN